MSFRPSQRKIPWAQFLVGLPGLGLDFWALFSRFWISLSIRKSTLYCVIPKVGINKTKSLLDAIYIFFQIFWKSQDVEVCLSLPWSTFVYVGSPLFTLVYLFSPWFTLCIREYQDSDFFPDQLQTFIERCIGPQRFQMWKNFSKISIPFRQV